MANSAFTNQIGNDTVLTTKISQDGSQVFAADAQASDTYVITLDPVPTAYTTGMEIHFSANTANTGACTLNVNSLGAKSIKKLHDQDPADNDIESGSIVTVIYDGTNFQMTSQVANAAAAGAWEFIETQTASASASVDFTDLTSAYIAYRLYFSTSIPASDGVNLLLRTSADNGSTYDAGTGYDLAYQEVAMNGGAQTGTGNQAASAVTISNNTGTAANESNSGYIDIINPAAATYTNVFYCNRRTDSIGARYYSTGTGFRISAAAVDAFQLLYSSGNIESGVYTLFGQKNS
jgi:hypothetical protein